MKLIYIYQYSICRQSIYLFEDLPEKGDLDTQKIKKRRKNASDRHLGSHNVDRNIFQRLHTTI